MQGARAATEPTPSARSTPTAGRWVTEIAVVQPVLHRTCAQCCILQTSAKECAKTVGDTRGGASMHIGDRDPSQLLFPRQACDKIIGKLGLLVKVLSSTILCSARLVEGLC